MEKEVHNFDRTENFIRSLKGTGHISDMFSWCLRPDFGLIATETLFSVKFPKNEHTPYIHTWNEIAKVNNQTVAARIWSVLFKVFKRSIAPNRIARV